MALLAPISHGFLEDDGGAPGLYVTEAGVVVIRSVQGGPLVPVGGGGGGGGGGTATIDTTSVPIGDAAIKDLVATPVEIVPAPGAGKHLQLISALVAKTDPGGFVPYTNVTDGSSGASTASVTYGPTLAFPAAAFIQDSNTYDFVYSNFFGSNADLIQLPPNIYVDPTMGNELQGADRHSVAGLGLFFCLANTGDLTGGDPANEIVVTVVYTTIDVG